MIEEVGSILAKTDPSMHHSGGQNEMVGGFAAIELIAKQSDLR